MDDNTKSARVDGAGLLDQLAETLRRYVVLPSSVYLVALALWILHTHAFAAARATPYLIIESAEKRSGKTILLELLSLLVRAGWRVVSPSPAVLYRKIERDCPTLLIDEVDSIFSGPRRNSEGSAGIREVINAGNRQGGAVPRCEGKQYEPRDFSVFCPKGMAGLSSHGLHDTVRDRSICLRLKRRRHSETVARFILSRVAGEVAPLYAEARSWAEQNMDQLAATCVEPLKGLDDRAFDGWEPLLAIADLCGGEWPRRAREAAYELSGSRDDSASIGVRLLSDICTIFTTHGADRMRTDDLLRALHAIETAPWGEWKSQRSDPKLSARELSRLLKPFEIGPSSVRLPDGTTPKGYTREQFEDAWARYLPGGELIYAPAGNHGSDAQQRHNLDGKRESEVQGAATPPTTLREGVDPDPASAPGCGAVAAEDTESGLEVEEDPFLRSERERPVNPWLDEEEGNREESPVRVSFDNPERRSWR